MHTEDATLVALPEAAAGFMRSSGGSIFAWHHAPPSALRRKVGIVLCPALEFEHASAYRTWRILAGRLASIGFDVVRFDYDGTGNSAGNPDDPDRFAAWQRSIACAIAKARQLAESESVGLIGLRGGALLALHTAATLSRVDRLVLWSPFTSGRGYIRELRAHAALSRQDYADADDLDRSINAAGHLVTRETIESLGGWTVDAMTASPASDVLIIERDDRPPDTTLKTHLALQGCNVDTIRPGGTAHMLIVPHLAQVPHKVVDQIVDWFSDWRPSAFVSQSPANGDFTTVALTDAYEERIVRFGSGGRLFGVMTSPRRRDSDRPSIVLFNTGVEHHIGPHRSHVPLARACASRGHTVLRFDLGGIGDSPATEGSPENRAYPGPMLSDAREAVGFVRAETPNSQVIAAGLCSGAWLAFRAAREGLPVDAVIAVNPPLYLNEGAAAGQWQVDRRELERYRESIRRPSKWAKALRGDAAYSVFARTAISAIKRRATTRITSVLGETLPDGLAKDLCAIGKRRIRTLFIFSRGDEGLACFQLQAPSALRRADVREFVRHVVVDGAGHSFRPFAAQRRLTELILDFVGESKRSRLTDLQSA